MEVLFALIISKFAIIVPLAIGSAALAHGGAGGGAGRLIAGLALVLIGCLAPWVLMRLIPLAEVASAAVGHVRGQLHGHAQLPSPETAAARKIAEPLPPRQPTTYGHDHDVAELLQSMTRRAQHAQPADAATNGRPAVAAEHDAPINTNATSPDQQRARADDSPVNADAGRGVSSRVDPRAEPNTDSPHVETNADPPTQPSARSGEASAPTGNRAAGAGQKMVRVEDRSELVAERGFKAFLQSNPKHTLAGNAQYWLGETYYARRDYQNAMTAFAEGYKVYRSSPKGPDNLLKLGVTLAVLGRKPDACAVFAKFSQDYPRATDLQKRRVEQERQKNGCG